MAPTSVSMVAVYVLLTSMHIFGSPSNSRFCGALPSGGGPSWVPTLPAAAAGVGVDGVVVVLEFDLALLLPPLSAPVRRARRTTTPAMTTPTAIRRRVCR